MCGTSSDKTFEDLSRSRGIQIKYDQVKLDGKGEISIHDRIGEHISEEDVPEIEWCNGTPMSGFIPILEENVTTERCPEDAWDEEIQWEEGEDWETLHFDETPVYQSVNSGSDDIDNLGSDCPDSFTSQETTPIDEEREPPVRGTTPGGRLREPEVEDVGSDYRVDKEEVVSREPIKREHCPEIPPLVSSEFRNPVAEESRKLISGGLHGDLDPDRREDLEAELMVLNLRISRVIHRRPSRP
jgi:hypothetical protein